MPRGRRAPAGLAAAALALAGCGGDDEGERRPAGADRQQTPAETTATERPPERTASEQTREERTAPAPEEQPGGAGDEVPARSPATFTGRGGRITPALVQVPAFIAVQVSLRSADGAAYRLEIAGRTLHPGRSVTLDGLRPGAAYSGRGSDGQAVRVEASAEPGP